jgi:3-deoxy-D-manno-octulosonic-acid transferase
LAFPLLLLYFLYRGLRDRRYFGTFWERMGARPASFQPTVSGGVWLHAVSVGEVLSSVRLIEELRSSQPRRPLFVSVTTLAGRKVADEKLAGLANCIFFAPVDYPFAIRRVLRRLRPAVLVVLETEIWPALYREVKRHQCSLAIVNGRISDEAFPRYRRWRYLFAAVLDLPDLIGVQTEKDLLRYRQLGATPKRLLVLGNLKYDAAVQENMSRDIFSGLKPESVVIAASTMPPADGSDVDEDDAVISAFQQLSGAHPGLLFILAPRKPERFALVASKLQRSGVAFGRRSAGTTPAQLPGVLLLDTLGELAGLFPLADVVFMGGSLARRGGHNLLEPAACGRAIIVGPHLENFAEIASDFVAGNGVLAIGKADELEGAMSRLLSDRDFRDTLGRRAGVLAQARRGATRRAVAEIARCQDEAIPVWIRSGPSRPLLWLLSRLWLLGLRRNQKRGELQARSLGKPVISVGGISMGGAGKTPLVDFLAERLRSRGVHPAVLTRGYGRRSIEDILVAPAGASLPSWKTGDEPQILLRSGWAHIGIGSDRYAVGRMIEQNLDTGVFLLDDGFQHWRLRRQLDIVLIDALNPFSGGAVFPLGFLREPLEALRRAGAIVLTRAQPGRAYAGIRDRIRAVNRDAPIFLATVEPREWIHEGTGRAMTVPPGPVVAFCGLANPASFWVTLAGLEIKPVFRWSFDDHHHYTQHELYTLGLRARNHGALSLLTTEKDAMNLPPRALQILAPGELYWLKIGTTLDDEKGLMQLVEQALTG